MTVPAEPRLLLVTGLAGAGKSTALKVLEDLGWEVVDNLPLSLLGPLLAVPGGHKLAIGIDARTRAFSPELVLQAMAEQLRAKPERPSVAQLEHERIRALKAETAQRVADRIATEAGGAA